MPQNRDSLINHARQTAEKAAYAAVGAPVAALKALNARIDELRETVKTSRAQISSELADEIDEWITQGEEVIERAMRRRRSTASEYTRPTAVTPSTEAQSVEPDEALTTVKGIGPGFADQLGKAGVVGISSFLDRTTTREGVEQLAVSSGVSPGTITAWRNQVDLARVHGVGEDYELVLHRCGIWTLEQLAAVGASDLAKRMRSVSTPDSPDQLPTDSVIEGWRREARRVSAG